MNPTDKKKLIELLNEYSISELRILTNQPRMTFEELRQRCLNFAGLRPDNPGNLHLIVDSASKRTTNDSLLDVAREISRYLESLNEYVEKLHKKNIVTETDKDGLSSDSKIIYAAIAYVDACERVGISSSHQEYSALFVAVRPKMST